MMTLIGKNTAIVSIGLSCQTGMQLRNNVEFASRIVKERLEYESSLFNFLACDSRGVESFLREEAHRPVVVGDIVPDDVMALRFKKHRMWLWHDSGDVTAGGIAKATAKYAYLASKFWALKDKKRRYFIISNVQNNLTAHPMNRNRDYTITGKQRRSIIRSINRAFPSGENRVFFICYKDRVAEMHPWMFEKWPKDKTSIAGHDLAWRRFLKFRLGKPDPVISLRERARRTLIVVRSHLWR